MIRGIWIRADPVDVMKVKFGVHKPNAQRPNVVQMKRLLSQPANAVDVVKRVSGFLFNRLYHKFRIEYNFSSHFQILRSFQQVPEHVRFSVIHITKHLMGSFSASKVRVSIN